MDERSAKLAPVLAGAILIAGLFRWAVPHPLMLREAMMLYAEVGILLAVSGWLFVYVNRWVGLFLASSTVSMLLPMYDFVSLLGTWQVLLLCLWYAAVKTSGDKDRIMDAVCVVVFVNLLVCFAQLLSIDFISTDDGELGAVIGLFTNPNECAALFAIGAFAFMRTSRPTLETPWGIFVHPLPWWAMLPAPIVGLVLTKSFGAALALCAGLGLLVYANGHRKAVLGVLLCLLAYLAVDRPEVAGMRMNAWVAAYKIGIQSPWVGIGTGHWKSTVPDSRGEWACAGSEKQCLKGVVWWDTAHNDYVQIFYDQGLKGLFIVFGFIISLFAQAWRKRASGSVQLLNAACAACCVSACFHWLMQNGATAVITVAYMALLDKEISAAF